MPSSEGAERIYTFIVVREAGREDRVVVWDTQDITVGRNPDNDVQFEDAEFSRRHAVFQREGDLYTLRDLGTSNGTRVNGTPIDIHTLRNKDVASVSGVRFAFFRNTRNPLSFGLKTSYSSQLKDFGAQIAAAAESDQAEATMLGLVETLPGESEELVVGPIDGGDNAFDLRGQPRLETGEIGAMGLDAEGFDTPGFEGADFDGDLDAPDIDAIGEFSRPASAVPVRDLDLDLALEAGAVSAEPFKLRLSIAGLSAEQRAALAPFLGRTIDLSALRVRIDRD